MAFFEPCNTEFYFVELVAPQKTRLMRNATENRLKHKASKRNLEWSNRNLTESDRTFRMESLPGEMPFENYMKIDNTELSPEIVAGMIRERFGL